MIRSLRHPDALLATWFGIGLAPIAPGTWGSLAAYPLAFAVAASSGPDGLYVVAVILISLGFWSASRYVARTRVADPKEVVIDEVAGQTMALAVAPFELLPWCAAFVLFRLFDILKPWPCSYFDRAVSGGTGVMADDLAAGVYAAAAMVALGELGAW